MIMTRDLEEREKKISNEYSLINIQRFHCSFYSSLTGFDGGHEYSQLFQPEQHNDPPEEHQTLNEIFIEIPQPNIRLDLCPVCSRKFAPESLLKHVIICEKVSTAKRTPFDSSKQRMNGPEFTTVAAVAQSPLTERRLTPSRVSPPKTVSC